MAHGLACPVCSATLAAADPTKLLPPHGWGTYEEPLELAARACLVGIGSPGQQGLLLQVPRGSFKPFEIHSGALEIRIFLPGIACARRRNYDGNAIDI